MYHIPKVFSFARYFICSPKLLVFLSIWVPLALSILERVVDYVISGGPQVAAKTTNSRVGGQGSSKGLNKIPRQNVINRCHNRTNWVAPAPNLKDLSVDTNDKYATRTDKCLSSTKPPLDLASLSSTMAWCLSWASS